MNFLDHTHVGINCPRCDYEIDVQMLAIRLEETMYCPCCKIIIQLKDSDASTHRALKNINAEFIEMQHRLKALN